MAKEKNKESKAVTEKKPTEVLPRAGEIDR
jgi:hypothetical protein